MSTDRRIMTAAILLAFLAVGAVLYFAAVAAKEWLARAPQTIRKIEQRIS
jgi:hypothetical protein